MERKDELHFLVDYENVRESGLDGIDYLNNTDALTIFYSGCCDRISRRAMECIQSSGCRFQAIRLKKAGKNALDFYIVSRVGELFGQGFEGKFIVVSKDKGYAAMKDYWMGCGIQSQRILLKTSIKDGIIATNEKSVRWEQISEGASQLSIEKEYAKYQERERLRQKIEELFKGTEYEESVARIFELTESEKNRKDLYIGSLKQFGKADGTKIYRLLKGGNVA